MTPLIDALAVYRLTRLVVEDKVTERARQRVDDVARVEGWSGLRYWLGCYWCASVPIAFGVVAARRVAPRAWDPVARALACSAVAGVVSEHT